MVIDIRNTSFFISSFCLAVLLHILQNVIKPSEQTLIFTATKHHVEYLKEVTLLYNSNLQ